MEFDAWLRDRLLELKTDEGVFGPYIKSIVEGDEDLEDKVEALDGILEGLGDASLDVKKLRLEILERWEASVKASLLVKGNGDAKDDTGPGRDKHSFNEEEGPPKLSLDKQLEQLLKMSPEELGGSSKSSRNVEEGPDSDLRAAILKQCQREEADSDDSGDEDGASGGLYKNTNAERVLGEQKEMKEKAKAEAAKKRERDREDRARQKKAAEERKEKAKKKATKVERKR